MNANQRSTLESCAKAFWSVAQLWLFLVALSAAVILAWRLVAIPANAVANLFLKW